MPKYIVLYNPLSKSGESYRTFKTVRKYFHKTKESYEIKSIIEIEDMDEFLSGVEDDVKFVFLGGDGTLNKLFGRLYNKELKKDLYLLRAGTGNDFARSVTRRRKAFIHLNPYLENLPFITYDNNVEEKTTFINGVGVGLDGLIAYNVNNTNKKKSKFNYFRETISSFFKYKPITMDVVVDGNEFSVDKVYLSTIMKAKYLAGGMMLAPDQKRDDNMLTLVIISKIPKFLLVFIFPLIYLGWHRIFKRYVEFYRGNEFIIKPREEVYMQMDGETENIKNNIHVVLNK